MKILLTDRIDKIFSESYNFAAILQREINNLENHLSEWNHENIVQKKTNNVILVNKNTW
jgi:hypothetical protein